ncbi:hypothetical protein [Selenomonas sp. KH1T6]|uniref:hypothetical protein n=1 Tax=Selenomonas sp. KH1T6 TaxID=3158784 RepID=UPI00094573F4
MEPAILKWFEMARIDIKNQGEGNDVKVAVAVGTNCNITQPQWFSKNGTGYVLETSDRHQILELTCHGAGKLMIRLMGIDRRSPKGERLPLWVDYTRLALNEEVIFWELKSQWHDRNYVYNRMVEDGEKIRVEISWDYHGYKKKELINLISMLGGVY